MNILHHILLFNNDFEKLNKNTGTGLNSAIKKIVDRIISDLKYPL